MDKEEMKKRIPQGLYCYDENGRCPWWSVNLRYPKQNNGYCSYLEKGDWMDNFGLLWDQVKECGVNEDWEDWEDWE
jgi:hypothetical protein